jgi:hypothetical protein
MGSILANVLSQYEQNYQNRALGAATTGLQYPETLLNSVLGPAMQEQQNLLMSQPYTNPWLQYVMPLLNMRTFENIATQKSGSEGIFGDLLKAGAELGSAWIKGPSKSPIVLA